jgi:hypothetical protein
LTRKQLADRIIYTLGMQDDTTFPESQYVLDLIFEAIQDISARTRANARVINLTTTPNTRTHDLSTTVIALLDLSVDYMGEPLFLDRFSREDIERMQRFGGWGYAWEEPLLWISPVWDVAMTVRAFGVFRPKVMTLDSDSPNLADYGGLAQEFHPTIVTYCLWKAGEYVQHEASGNGEKWRVQYEGEDGLGGEIGKIKRLLNKRATPGGPRRRRPGRSSIPVPDLSYYTGG